MAEFGEYKITDRRGKEDPKEVCRVCGSSNLHTRDYNKPTMPCVQYLRTQAFPEKILRDALAYIKHVGAGAVMQNKPHPQQWLVDEIEGLINSAGVVSEDHGLTFEEWFAEQHPLYRADRDTTHKHGMHRAWDAALASRRKGAG